MQAVETFHITMGNTVAAWQIRADKKILVKLIIEFLKLKYLQKKVLTSTEETELNKYLYVLEETLDWKTKDEYVELWEQFLSGEINSFTFSSKFKERNDLNTEVFNIFWLLRQCSW